MEEGYRQREFHASLQRLRARSREERDADAQQTREPVITQPSAADRQVAAGSAEEPRGGGLPGDLQDPRVHAAETSSNDHDDVPQDDELAGGDGDGDGDEYFHEEEGPMGFVVVTVNHMEFHR